MITLVVMRNRIVSSSLALPFLVVLGSACGPGLGTDAGTDAAAAESCNVFDACEGGLTCCGGVCVDTETDPDHCGACGLDCSAEGGFCASGGSCAALAFNALCENSNLLALYDGNPPDDATTDILRDEVAAMCGVSAENASTTDSSLVENDGRPLVGVGTTVVMGGGGFFQPPIRYVEELGVTPVYVDQVDLGATSRIVRRADGDVLASVPSTTTGEGEDWFVVYLVEEPERGAVLLAAYGFTLNGTEAAGVWARDAIFRDPGAIDDTWWVVRWVDSDPSAGPTSGDTFEVVDSGR